MKRTVSLPHEHGGYLTLAGAIVAGVVIAEARAEAMIFGVVLAAAFFGRAPLEQLAIGRAERWDRLALGAWVALAALGIALLERRSTAGALAAGAIASLVAGSSVLARIGRHHRTRAFELVGMAAVGGSAGAIALVGDAPLRAAALLALVLAVHAATAVPLVRSELRPHERVNSVNAERITMVALVAVAIGLAFAHAAPLAWALVPRALHVAVRHLPALRLRSPALVGLRETVALAATVAIALFNLGIG